MSYTPRFRGWDELSISDLLIAYRKAKADCFFENNFPTAIGFADYESNLLANLSALLNDLKNNKGFAASDDLLGIYRIFPKKLTIDKRDQEQASKGHIHFSDSKRTFKNLIKINKLEPQFRIVGDFPVDAHILSALWINMVGHKFDACLNNENIYGSRLKRVGNEDKIIGRESRPFHISAIGSFKPYFHPYRKWREDGLSTIREELKLSSDKSIIAVSMDLKSYYHLLFPDFISSEDFQREIGVSLDNNEINFTKQISEFLCRWSEGASSFASSLLKCDGIKINGGLAIGIAASRIISNIALYKWDKLICDKLTPAHYGRYVDDMLLVIDDPSEVEICDTSSFMEFLSSKLGVNNLGEKVLCREIGENKQTWEIKLGKSHHNSRIELQADKQKLFILKGQAGIDLVDSIEQEILELSSEHRLMPEPSHLEHSAAVRALTAAETVGEEADTLRRADGLTMRRLGWALQMRHVETLAHDLPKDEWKGRRNGFYDLAYNHLLKADKIFTHFKYLPRLLGFAVNLKDWRQVRKIIKKSYEIISLLSKNSECSIVVNGSDLVKVDEESRRCIWGLLKDSMAAMLIDVIACSYPVDLLGKKTLRNRFIRTAEPTDDSKLLYEKLLKIKLPEKALSVFFSDLAKVPYKRSFSNFFDNKLSSLSREVLTNSYIERQQSICEVFEKSDLVSLEDLKEFLTNTKESRIGQKNEESILPFIFPTRPLTPCEIAEYSPFCVGLAEDHDYKTPLQLWAHYVKALRGAWVSNESLEQEGSTTDSISRRLIEIGNEKKKTIVVALTNFIIDESDWKRSVHNNSNLSIKRYAQISELVNQAIRLKPKPDYLILPELSLPLRWVDSVSNRLQNVGISLIAGTEYRHFDNNAILSEACLVLSDYRLGYKSYVKIWQPKVKPAVLENTHLIEYGKSWKDFLVEQKPVYVHNGFHFSVMVCSELLNSKDRISFQGQIDAIMILAWNKDLPTFSKLIGACALDLHAYTILVNNRLYGDSRVRSPAKKSFKRDIARLRGGENDFCTSVKLDINQLRKFQNKGRSHPSTKDHFKPIPDGFEMLPTRKHFSDSMRIISTEVEPLKKSYSDPKPYIIELSEVEIKEKFKEEIVSHFNNSEMKDLDEAIEKAFSRLGSKIRFGRKRSCQIVWHGEAGSVRDYRNDNTLNWGKGNIKIDKNHPSYKEISKEELEERQRLLNAQKEKAENDRISRQELAARKAQSLFEKYKDQKNGFCYLEKKGVSTLKIKDIRYNNETLIIPLYDTDKKIWSLQFIKKDSSKIFLKHSRTQGNFFILQDHSHINDFSDEKEVYLTEGIATAGTLYLATGKSVIVCFNAKNIEYVFDNLVKKFPDKKYIIAADNDLWKRDNTGKRIAEEMVQKYKSKVNVSMKLPNFAPEIHQFLPTDFNDLHKLMGIDEVIKQIK